MECEVCNIRSAVGACEETHIMICEECSTGCYACGKRIASTKGHETKSGHIYCTPCFKERASKRASRQQRRDDAETGREGLLPQGPGAEEEAEIAEEALVLSRWEAPPPWKMSMWLGIAGVVIMVFFLLFPNMRGMDWSADRYIPFAPIALILPLIAAAWGAIGLFHKAFWADRERCFIGIGLAAVAVVLTLFASQPPPLSAAEQELRDSRPEFQTEQERAAWRQQMLRGRP